MEHRTLGRTGVSLSVVGFGAMTIGGNYGPVDDAQSLAALHAAVDAGMNFIDTSDAYGAGRSETVLARFLAERPDRDRIVVATKGGNDQTTGTTSFEPAYIARCVEASLSRLGCETLDLYLLHNPKLEEMQAELSFDLLDRLVAEGRIRHWGVSVNTLPECEFVVANGRPAFLQMEYNVASQAPAAVFEECARAGIGVICRVPMKRGFLAGRFDTDTQWQGGDRRARTLTPENMARMQPRLAAVQAVSGELGITPAAVALRFCVSNPDVSTVVSGIRTPAQASANAAAAQPLPANLLATLRD